MKYVIKKQNQYLKLNTESCSPTWGDRKHASLFAWRSMAAIFAECFEGVIEDVE